MINAYVGKIIQVYAHSNSSGKNQTPWLIIDDDTGAGKKSLEIGIAPFESNNLFTMMTAAATSNSEVLVLIRKVEPSTISGTDEAIVEAFLVPPLISKEQREKQINTLKAKYVLQGVDAVKLT